MPFKIKARLAAIGRKQVELIPELRKRGIEKITPADLSNALSGMSQTPKSSAIVSAANEIVTEWEKSS